MRLVGVRVELPTNNPIVLLREAEGEHRVLPIFIGAVEATAIAFALQGVVTQRPLTRGPLPSGPLPPGHPAGSSRFARLARRLVWAPGSRWGGRETPGTVVA